MIVLPLFSFCVVLLLSLFQSRLSNFSRFYVCTATAKKSIFILDFDTVIR